MFNNPDLLNLVQRLDSKNNIGGPQSAFVSTNANNNNMHNPNRINSIQYNADILSIIQRQISN